jgi:hypothetical protein
MFDHSHLSWCSTLFELKVECLLEACKDCVQSSVLLPRRFLTGLLKRNKWENYNLFEANLSWNESTAKIELTLENCNESTITIRTCSCFFLPARVLALADDSDYCELMYLAPAAAPAPFTWLSVNRFFAMVEDLALQVGGRFVISVVTMLLGSTWIIKFLKQC